MFIIDLNKLSVLKTAMLGIVLAIRMSSGMSLSAFGFCFLMSLLGEVKFGKNE